jgi:hypothetical protein
MSSLASSVEIFGGGKVSIWTDMIGVLRSLLLWSI